MGVLHGVINALSHILRQLDVLVVGQLDKAFGKLGIIGLERGVNFCHRGGAVEGARQRPVADRHWIIVGLEQRIGLDRQRRAKRRGDGKADRGRPGMPHRPMRWCNADHAVSRGHRPLISWRQPPRLQTRSKCGEFEDLPKALGSVAVRKFARILSLFRSELRVRDTRKAAGRSLWCGAEPRCCTLKLTEPWPTISFPTSTTIRALRRSEEHTSELQSRGLVSYAVFCLK